ncbi:Hpt domain-containing protein [Mariniflexile jejuense]|uniref:Hpt domain-containing protein n=1 Tax=Mariniflexile jejuense TaxID=1173582 RepID=A0ABW3JEY8_9FLAO
MTEQPNLEYLKQFSGGDQAFEKKLFTVLKKEFPVEKETYFQNLKLNNFKLASENVHKIKHKISILGLEKSYQLATEHENNLRESNASLKDEFQTVLNVITDFLETLNY